MYILGIESSCDDTSVALLDASEQGLFVVAQKTASQIDIHKKYGGVVPEIAGRKHAEAIIPLIEEVLADAFSKIQVTSNKIQPKSFKPDVIAVTAGPGLITGLLVGIEAAKTLSYLWDVPLIPVNHIEGHIYSVLLQETNNLQSSIFNFPVLCLVVSGGHTEIILMKDHCVYEKIGGTRDDAAGECFDKVAKLLGIEYPGGPKVSKLAESGDPKAIHFPRPMLDSGDYDFSFAGLKTAALYWLRDNAKQSTPTTYTLSPVSLQDFCASFEQAIIDVLVTKTVKAIEQYNPKTLILGGGVSANKKLRETLAQSIPQSCEFRTASMQFTTDNGAMIAAAGYFHAIKNEFTPWDKVTADPNWKVYSSKNS